VELALRVAGLAPVVGQQGREHALLADLLLVPVRQPVVQRAALRAQQRPVGHLLEDGLAELVAVEHAGRGQHGDEVAPGQAAEVAADLIVSLRAGVNIEQRRIAEGAPDHRGDLDRQLLGHRQPVDTAQHQALDGLGHGLKRGRVAQHAVPALDCHRPALAQIVRQLFDQERVAGRAAFDQGGQVGRHAAGLQAARSQRGCVGVVKRS
jgi:hypothetical protein